MTITPEQLAEITLSLPIFSGVLDPAATSTGQFSHTVSSSQFRPGQCTAQKGATAGLWHLLIANYPGDGNVEINVNPGPNTFTGNPSIGFAIVPASGGFDIITYDTSQGGSGSGEVKDALISFSVYLRGS